MLKLDITHDAAKFIKKLPLKQFKQVTMTVLSLMKNPEPHDSQQLSGKRYSRYRRADIREYRIIYRYDDEFLFVVVVGKRNDGEVYKRFSP